MRHLRSMVAGLIAALGLTLSPMAYGASSYSQKIRGGSFGNIFDSVEASPVFRNDGGLFTFPIGLTVTGELELEGHLFWHAGVTHYQLGRREIRDGDGFRLRDVRFTRKHVMTNGLFGGIRYYHDPFGNSWYGGVQLGFHRIDGSYIFDQANVTETTHFVPLALQAGFRLVLHAQVSARMGVTIPENFVLSQRVSNEISAEVDSNRLEALQFRNLSVVDMGLAYHF